MAHHSMVDWELAATIGAKVAGEGPTVTRAEADEAVAEIRADARRSTGLVADYTGLDASADSAPILVVDRPGWVRANTQSFRKVIDPLTDRLTTGKRRVGPVGTAVGSRVTGTEVGLLLGFLGGKVLGQFDPFHGVRDPVASLESGPSAGPAGGHESAGRPTDTLPATTVERGRLLLVAPNVVHVERELEVDPRDFRLWVCLHEETHRVQFTAVPWMREHLFAQVRALTDTVQPQGLTEDVLSRAFQALRGEGGGSLVEVMSTPEQREILDRVTGMMSLLEGHADVVMDGVGPSVIPSVAQIRAKFTERRKGVGPLDRVLRRLLGLEAKMAQYRDGAIFVRSVVDRVGMADFNAVWAAPDNLPSKAEILDPDAWVRRVLA